MRVIVALILLMVCGCATTKPIEPQRLSQIKRVGAISLLGDKLNVVQVGTTAFNNVNKYEEVRGWDVDGFTTAQIQKYLTTNPSYTFVPIALEQNELADIYRSQHRFPYSDFDIDYVKEKLVNIGKSYGIDTLFLVLSTRQDMTGNNHYMHGYGVFSRSLFGAEVGASFSLGATIAVIDLRTLEVLSISPLKIYKHLERGVWKETISQYSPEELTLLKSYTLDGIRSQIPINLEKLGFLR